LRTINLSTESGVYDQDTQDHDKTAVYYVEITRKKAFVMLRSQENEKKNNTVIISIFLVLP